MCGFLFSIYIIMLALEANAYVLLQVRKKDGNHSNIDAIIHKVVPAGKFEEIAKKLAVRKQFTSTEHYKMRAKDDDNVRRNDGRQSDNLKASNERDASEVVSEKTVTDVFNLEAIEKALFGLAKNYGKAVSRASNKDSDLAPEVIHFRNEKPSLVYKINSNTIMKAINTLLSSRIFTDYVDNFTRKAAVVYRALKNEMDN